MKMLSSLGITALLLLLSAASVATELTSGKPAPTMQTAAQLLSLKDDNISYQDWQGRTLTGKVRVVHHLNAALGVDGINKPFIDSVKALNLDTNDFTTLTVLNIADVASFLKTMAKLQIEDLQRTHSEDEYVLDDQASVRSAWGLPNEGPSITLVDASGTVLAHKDGKLNPEEVKEFVALIQQNLPQ